MKNRILVLLTMLTVWVAVGVAQQPNKVAKVEEVNRPCSSRLS